MDGPFKRGTDPSTPSLFGLMCRLPLKLGATCKDMMQAYWRRLGVGWPITKITQAMHVWIMVVHLARCHISRIFSQICLEWLCSNPLPQGCQRSDPLTLSNSSFYTRAVTWGWTGYHARYGLSSELQMCVIGIWTVQCIIFARGLKELAG